MVEVHELMWYEGIKVIDGVPHIWDVPAIAEEPPTFLADISAPFRCPHCNGFLSLRGFICLNACHLNGPQLLKFQAGMRAAAARTKDD